MMQGGDRKWILHVFLAGIGVLSLLEKKRGRRLQAEDDVTPSDNNVEDDEEEDGEEEHEFVALNTLLLVVVLSLCILSAYLIKKHRFYFMPESSAALCVGLIVGGLARLMTSNEDELNFISFKPELFFFLLLPPIIFEAGYTLRRKNFFRNLGTIAAFAVFGTLISTFIVGYLTFACAKGGLIKVDGDDPMEALVFGSLISAVDPVATLSIMGSAELNCDPLLYSLVFGESVLNDAVAIVLFNTFKSYHLEHIDSLNKSQVGEATVRFFGISIGSVFIGIITGLVCSYIFRHTRIRDYPKYEIALLFLFAYGAYAVAESIELSGIMALFFAGIILAHYNSYNLSKISQTTAEEIFASLACVSETFVFMYMGMGVFTGRFKSWDFNFVLLAIFFCLLGRALNTFPLSALSNRFRNQSNIIPIRMQFVIWFAGLRGAIAFALSQNMSGANREAYETTTLSIVVFTTVVCGGLTEPMLRYAGMKRGQQNGSNDTQQNDRSCEDLDAALPLYPSQNLPQTQSFELRSIDGPVDADAARIVARENRHTSPAVGFHAVWRDFDDKYLKPLFGGSAAYMNDDDDDNDDDIHHNPVHP